jgi:hypothetical protein
MNLLASITARVKRVVNATKKPISVSKMSKMEKYGILANKLDTI